MDREWLIEENKYDPKKELLMETLYALSNGYMSCRGTLEEGNIYNQVRQYYGTYAAGTFDKYNKDYQAIVNLPYFFNTQIKINHKPLNILEQKIENYVRYLDMYYAVLVRKFVVKYSENKSLEFEITRFLSKSSPHLAVLQYRIKSNNFKGNLQIDNILDGNVTNIDFHVSGYQLRDEKYYFIDDKHEVGKVKNGGYLTVNTKKTNLSVCELFKCNMTEDTIPINPKSKYEIKNKYLNNILTIKIKENKEYLFTKMIGVYTSNDKENNLKQAAEKVVDESFLKGFNAVFSDHISEWNKIWYMSDIKISGSARDQKNVRFNIFHLIQMGNKDNPYVNIGSRGLTSEMHYGNCFWDTELFILPFFIYSDPDTAKALIKYRYLTLPEARSKAKALWFKGAMFPWMSSYPGKEQADYWEYANIAVHIVSDVIYGLIHYYEVTDDHDFMLDYGLEMLIETARFWESRCYYNNRINKYVINTTKGPNEYDGVVNNNTYTNWSAQWNLIQAKQLVLMAKKEYPAKFQKLANKIKFKVEEMNNWTKIINKMKINYDKQKDLFIEDDSFLDKSPVDLKKLRPGKKISTEMGWTWDTIIQHRVVKQADVLLLMSLHRENFTQKQLINAWNFYEPITLHDSSLSYNTHAIIAAELGNMKKSYDYFQQTLRLDIDDLMDNSFLGIHAANTGGAWQCVINGYCGMRLTKQGIEFHPYLPKEWKKVEFSLKVRNNLCKVVVEKNSIKIEQLSNVSKLNNIKIEKNKILFK